MLLAFSNHRCHFHSTTLRLLIFSNNLIPVKGAHSYNTLNLYWKLTLIDYAISYVIINARNCLSNYILCNSNMELRSVEVILYREAMCHCGSIVATSDSTWPFEAPVKQDYLITWTVKNASSPNCSSFRATHHRTLIGQSLIKAITVTSGDKSKTCWWGTCRRVNALIDHSFMQQPPSLKNFVSCNTTSSDV